MGTLYENIMELCEEAHISGGKMCDDLILSRGFLSDRKSGRKEGANTETVKKIADYFGVSVDRVIFGKEKAPADGEDVLQNLKDEERILLHSYRTMTEQQKQMVAVFLKGLKDIEGE